MNRPVIAIAAKPQMHRENDYWHRLEMVDEIRALLVNRQAVGVMLLPLQPGLQYNDNDLGDDTVLTEEEIDGLRQQLDLVDGLILQGGDYSCQYEVELVRLAMSEDKPVLGICAGFNNILRALGSNTFEDRDRTHSHYDIDYRHHITVEPGTLLHEFTGSDSYEVNSFHQMVATDKVIPASAVISSHSDDGYVESFEVPGYRFVMGVKWHPEQMNDEVTDRMIRAFIQACRREHE